MNNTEILHTRHLDYEHMGLKKLENIIKILDYFDYIEENQNLIKILNKRIKKRYNPEMDRKRKVKTLVKYNRGGRK